MNTSSTPVTDAASVASVSGRRSFFARFRRSARLVAFGLAVLLILAELAVGLRLAGPGHWWRQPEPEEEEPAEQDGQAEAEGADPLVHVVNDRVPPEWTRKGVRRLSR